MRLKIVMHLCPINQKLKLISIPLTSLKIKYFKTILLAFIATFPFASPAFSEQHKVVSIQLMTEIFPPFQYRHQDKTIGISTDIVNAIQRKLNLDNKINIHQWSEAKKIVDSIENTALFSMLRTPERENQYKWVGPLASMKMVFFKKKGSKITLNNIDDAKKINKIGVTKGVANYEMLSNQGFKNLEALDNVDDEHNIQKLVNGDIDLWPTLLMTGLYNARLSGLYGEIEPIKGVVAFQGDLYIAFNLQTSDDVILQWQNALDQLKKGGAVANIIQRYEFEKTDYSFLIKIFIGIFLIVAIILYHNRKLAYMNKQLQKLQNELQEQAHRDHLTGLYNRRYFNNIASSIIKIGKRNKHQTGIIILDIDNFKKINDAFGHNTGDDIIKILSMLLLKSVRSSDIVARFGGDEFVILLPNSNLNEAINIASKIRKSVENYSVIINPDKTLKFTISLGVDHVIETDKDISLALIRADKSLYEAKNKGRNKIEHPSS